MTKLTTTQARKEFSETISRVAYGRERVVLERNGKDLAAVVPIEDLEILRKLEDVIDLKEALAALKEKGPNVPWEEVKEELGL